MKNNEIQSKVQEKVEIRKQLKPGNNKSVKQRLAEMTEVDCREHKNE